MKRRFGCSLLLSCLLLCFACQSALAQYKPSWRTVPAVIYTGDTIGVVYDPVVAGYGDSLPVKGYVYVYRNFEWKGYDFPLTKTDTGYVGPFVIPEGTAALAWRFWVGDSIDNGRRFPNFAVVHDGKTRQMASGAYTEYALIRRRDRRGRISPLVREESLIEPRVMTIYLPKEWLDLSVRRHRFPEVALNLREAYGNRVDSVLRAGAAEIAALPDVTEKDLLTLANVYDGVFENRKGADSIKAIARAKYPNGLAVRLNEIFNLYLARTDSARVAGWDQFARQWPAAAYPYTDYLDEHYGDAHFFTGVLRNMSNIYYRQKNWKALSNLFSTCPYLMLEDSYTHFIDYALRLDEPPHTEKELAVLGQTIIDTMLVRSKSADSYRAGRGLYAESEWAVLNIRMNKSVFAYQAVLLAKLGRYKDALRYAEIVRPYMGSSKIEFNHAYALSLAKTGREKDALQVIRAAIYTGSYTPEMLDILRKQYVKEHKSDKDFADYVTSLISKEYLERQHEEIRKSMVNLPATDFTLLNTKGQQVALAQQKGKIVVIDFWATWCYYCKLAMPGMQMAVDKYQQDKNVAFYFIATMEQHPDYKKMITDFIKEKQYSFNVLYDDKNPATGKLDAVYAGFAPALKASGIPLKVIIDQEGKVRWSSTGGSANHIALADEVSYVIELLKKEKG
ncbi:redoxin domain-containing protein [Chitinophaga horti]|uniref:Redoxin domain-containing protein n=1 Tax=Chitinophaga horti TaxID=2920382 RepID=A0ABY6J733_9BACT|nr:redoxin domain-containing protein [Chitinophaga horti]UYQ95481.1 redoxin domain-containing protein [Chitinophaga horti]